MQQCSIYLINTGLSRELRNRIWNKSTCSVIWKMMNLYHTFYHCLSNTQKVLNFHYLLNTVLNRARFWAGASLAWNLHISVLDESSGMALFQVVKVYRLGHSGHTEWIYCILFIHHQLMDFFPIRFRVLIMLSRIFV